MSPKTITAKSPESSSATEASAPPKRQSHPTCRILVVDDDTVIRSLCSKVLIRSGYRVDMADDGEAGWKVLHAVRSDPNSYDLLIADNHLPILSGVELVKKLRAARMDLPVILASGASPKIPECLCPAESLKLAAILPKPFSPDQLVQTVREILHKAQP